MVTLRSMPPSGSAPSSDPRARAAQTKRVRTRGLLLDAAETTFSSKGWARSRIEDVAATAGVSAATAYNHFPSKHSLIGHVYAPLIKPLLRQAELDVEAGRPVVEALDDQVRALVRTSARYRVLTATFFAAVQDYTIRVEGPADPADEVDPRVLVPVPESIRVLVEHGQKTRQLRAFPPADEISTILVNLLLLRAMNRPDEEPDSTAEVLLTMLFGALRPDLLTEGGDRPFARPR